jgi:hypothetical protein
MYFVLAVVCLLLSLAPTTVKRTANPADYPNDDAANPADYPNDDVATAFVTEPDNRKTDQNTITYGNNSHIYSDFIILVEYNTGDIMPDTSTKSARTVAKRTLTKEINYARQCIAEGNTDNLHEQVKAIKHHFDKFSAIHADHQETLTTDDDIDASETYFSKEQDNYIKVLDQVKSVFSELDMSMKSEMKSESHSATDITRELLTVLNMPKVELEMFNGDPLQFHQFIRAFELNVGEMCTDDNLKLTRLIQYTQGPAKDAIRSCLLIGGYKGYSQAMSILHNRFGNKHLVTERLIHDLKQAKPVKSAQEVQQLADDIKNAEMILSQLDMLNEVNSQSTIISIVGRLQPYLQIKWKKRALSTKKTKGSYPCFRELVEFVSDMASEVNDPVYGNMSFRKPDSHPKHKTSSASFTMSVGTAEGSPVNRKPNSVHIPGKQHSSYARPEPDCVLCKQQHRLWHCSVFKQMSPRERLSLVTRHKLCENCFLATHDASSCGKRTVCCVPGCGKKHSMYIHVPVDDGKSHSTSQGNSVSNGASNVNTSCVRDTHMPIVQVLVNDSVKALALLDSGSSNSFCSRKLAQQLGLEGQQVTYQLHTLSKSDTAKSKMVHLSLLTVSGETLGLSGVYVTDKIPAKTAPLDPSMYAHLSDIELTSLDRVQEVDLLIGQDFSEALIPLEVRKGKSGEPFAIKTILGWCVNGQSPVGRVGRPVVSQFVSSCFAVRDDDVHAIWKLENNSDDMDELGWSLEDKSVIDLWDRECVKVDGHFQLPIPWKNRDEHLPNNYVMAKSRLESTVKKLEKQQLFERYDSEISKLLSNGYAEIVPSEQVHTVERVWYLPHHAVVTEKKPDKMRVVFDCAAKFQGKSLNERCKQGPDLIKKLMHVLLRFRQHRFAIQADIEAMYHQVKIPVDDRDALRFLWYCDGEIITCRMSSHLFGGVWCASSSAYALMRTALECEGVSPLVLSSIERSFYVDDFLKSVIDRLEAEIVVQCVPEVLITGGFNLTKFVVNDEQLLENVSENNRAKEVKDFGPESSGKALGVRWNIMADMFVFDVHVKEDHSVSRRKMLSIISSMFDPLGLVGFHVLLGKLIFQDATRLRYDWDTPIPSGLCEQWNKWIQSLVVLNQVQVPRCVKPLGFDDAFVELHHFSDASEAAYGCCSYLRCVNKEGRIHTQLVMAKNRVAPIKSCTIPRLELQAAVLAAKVDSVLRKELEIKVDQSFFWVDSKIVLAYISNCTRRFQTFVEHRVGLIRQLSSPSQWHHISGKCNPADVLSRGQLFGKLDIDLWFNGPIFLRQYKHQWNVSDVTPELTLGDPEVKREPVRVNACNDVTMENPVDKIVNYYSDWSKMKRALAWWLRLVDLCKHRHVVQDTLSVDEVKRGELLLVKHAQNQHYSDEIEKLSDGRGIKKSSSLKSLNPYVDSQGVLCVGGRLSESKSCEKNPIIIPGSHVIAKVVAREFHNEAHLGTEWTLSLCRQQYWITKARPMIKNMIKSCIICRKLFAKPREQIMANLPQERIEPDRPPFTYVGVDVFGPFMVKVNRSELKRYGCMFTCFVSRAVHIEMLHSLETESFINGFRRFVARRGSPEKVYSDNGTNFVGANTELRKALRDLSEKEIKAYAVKNSMDWHFNPPAASHMGGAWERMIGCARRVMQGLLHGPVRLTDEILETLFAEIESILNGRPLTKLSDDPDDPTPLTPNHLLLLRAGSTLPPGKFDKADIFRRRWRHVQHLSNQFWFKWVKLYLPELQKRVKWTDLYTNLKKGDLVLLSDVNTPRNLWPLGIVQEISEGRDGLVRSVRLKTRTSELVRPITKVILLESAL